jgi:hypothetical protein
MHHMISLPPPAEFMGKARRYVGLVEVDEKRFNDQIINPCQAIMWARLHNERALRQKGTLRQEVMQKWLTEWRRFQGFGQSRPVAELLWSKRRVEFRDMRLATMSVRNASWDEDERELSVGVMVRRLVWEGTRHENTVYTNATGIMQFGIHALARYFQKGFQPTEAGLTAAIWSAVNCRELHDVYDSPDVDFSLPVPSGGRWYGRWVRVQSVDTREELNQQIDRVQAKPELAVRTFHCDKD